MTDRDLRKFQIRSGGFGRSLVKAVDAASALREYPGFPPGIDVLDAKPDGSYAATETADKVRWEAVEIT